MRPVVKFRFEIAVLIIWAIAIAAKYKYNGLVFGFDYGNYQPDGKYYTYMALEYLNHNPAKSAQQVVDWYLVHGFKMNTFTIQDLMPNTSYAYPMISHRILYPLLSVPFVAVFGIPGMLAIPALSLLVLFLSIQILSKKMNKPFIGLGIVLTLVFSTTVLRWMMVNCTDALLVGLFALAPFSILAFQQRNRWAAPTLGLLIVLTSATRFVLPFWLAILFVLAVRYKRALEIGFLLILSFLCSIPALQAQASSALLPAEADSPLYIKLAKLPLVFIKVFAIDIAEFGVLDRAFLVFILFCFIQAIRLRKTLSAQLFTAVLFAGYIIGSINGTLGVNFRYQIPVLIFSAWLILDSLEISGCNLRFVSSAKGYVVVNKTQ
jgi:hypothetical protein